MVIIITILCEDPLLMLSTVQNSIEQSKRKSLLLQTYLCLNYIVLFSAFLLHPDTESDTKKLKLQEAELSLNKIK